MPVFSCASTRFECTLHNIQVHTFITYQLIAGEGEMMNPVVVVAIAILLFFYTGLFAAMSLVGFISGETLGPKAGQETRNAQR